MPSANKALADLLDEIDRLVQEIPAFVAVGDGTAISNFRLVRLRDAKDAMDRASGRKALRRHASRALPEESRASVTHRLAVVDSPRPDGT